MDCVAADDGIDRETDWIRMFINEKCNKENEAVAYKFKAAILLFMSF